MTYALTLALIAGYALGTALLLRAGLRSQPSTLALYAGAAAVLAHGLLLFAPMLTGVPDGTGFFRALSMVAFAMALTMTAAGLRERTRPLLVAIWPIALLAAPLGAFIPGSPHGAGTGWQIRLHVVIALSAYALLSIAALQALLVAWQEHNLRTKRFGPALRALPPLVAMESLLFQMIVAGFALLTLTILSGALFIDDWMAQSLVHKTVLTIVAWVVFGLLIAGHWRFGWRGRTAVRFTLAGMGLLLLAFFGSKFVLELILHR
jgi:ABC-type uncharacterized transport system permease subunit